MIKAYIVIVFYFLWLIFCMIFMCHCTHISFNPDVALKVKCEIMHKTDYIKQQPEQKCGVVVESRLIEVK